MGEKNKKSVQSSKGCRLIPTGESCLIKVSSLWSWNVSVVGFEVLPRGTTSVVNTPNTFILRLKSSLGLYYNVKNEIGLLTLKVVRDLTEKEELNFVQIPFSST